MERQQIKAMAEINLIKIHEPGGTIGRLTSEGHDVLATIQHRPSWCQFMGNAKGQV